MLIYKDGIVYARRRVVYFISETAATVIINLEGGFLMKTKNEQLKQWAIDQIEKNYKDDVSLLIGYDCAERLDIAKPAGPYTEIKDGFDFFIPETGRAHGLAKTFIINGIGYDLYPRSWERIEEAVNLDEYNLYCLADAEILYARSQADVDRFEDARHRFFANLADKSFSFKKALGNLSVAMELYQTMMFSEALAEVRMSAGFIADYLARTVALANGRYFKHTQMAQLEEMKDFAEVPANFANYYNGILAAESIDELKKLSHLLILTTRKFMEANKPQTANKANVTDYQYIADWYQELCWTFRRIYHCVYINDRAKAFMWGCMLQQELNALQDEQSLTGMDCNIMDHYNPNDLSALKARAEALEKQLLDLLAANNVKLDKYDSVDEFLSKNA